MTIVEIRFALYLLIESLTPLLFIIPDNGITPVANALITGLTIIRLLAS